MNHIISKLLIYGDMPKDSILIKLGEVFKDFSEQTKTKDELRVEVYRQIKRILDLTVKYGFNENLWHNYLTFLLINGENPFSLQSEKVGAIESSINYFVNNDFKAFYELFNYDFSEIEKELDIDCFKRISDYKANENKKVMYNKNMSEKVQALSRELESAKDEKDIYKVVTNFYKKFGVGSFGLNKAFRIHETEKETMEIVPINNMDNVLLSDLVGYEIQKQELVENTKAFVEGRKANNVLLYGDSGTGKSTSIKAIVNEFYNDGLRMIEIYKHQFKHLSELVAKIKNRNYKFIIYMDDLSFEEFEIEYKYLKAVIEGGVETKPSNVLIYATSNRRHLIKENWNDRDDMETASGIHRSDTIEEKLSLAGRFGVKICYMKPSFKEYYNIVLTLAHRAGIDMTDDEIRAEANKWELSHGGVSGRIAEQFITYLLGKNE